MNAAQTRAAITKLTGERVSTYCRLDSPATYDCQADSGGINAYWCGYAGSRATATLNTMTRLLNNVKERHS